MQFSKANRNNQGHVAIFVRSGYKSFMIQNGAIVLYKTHIGRIDSFEGGKYLVEFQESPGLRLRDKDFSLIHPGPVARLPSPRSDGDFETAYGMIATSDADARLAPLEWKDFAELVFGEFTPEAAVACVNCALEGKLFFIADGKPSALSAAEREKLAERERKKGQEVAARQGFVAWFSLARKSGKSGRQGAAMPPEYAPLLQELTSFALGRTARCSLAGDLGLSETPEAVHQALLDTGIWADTDNPWPSRAGCNVNPPKAEFPAAELEPVTLPRIDLTFLPSYAIDNAWSNDPDDAISFDGSHVWVHVADPAAYIKPGSALDVAAMERGATLYLPEKTVPMLPGAAVTTLGLGIAPRSPALSFRINVEADGSIRDIMISPSVVKVTRLSYEKADELLRQGEPALVALSGIAEARRRRRIANGAVEISFPETSVKVDGAAIAFLPVHETRSGGMVREMMLLAGEAAGRWAKERSLPFLYSSQEASSIPQEALAGMELPAPLSVQYLRRKGMRASIVGTESLAHRGLGLSFYSQVTSPLRRYQDLLTHYQIRLSLQNERGAAAEPLPEEELGRRCLVASQAAAQTRQAERDSRMHWTVVYLSRNQDWRGEATVLDIRDREAWILIKEFGLETGLRCRQSLSPDETISVKAVMAKIPSLASNFEMI